MHGSDNAAQLLLSLALTVSLFSASVRAGDRVGLVCGSVLLSRDASLSDVMVLSG